MLNPLKQAFKQVFAVNKPEFMAAADVSQRQVTNSFCYVQLIDKGNASDVWFPSESHRSFAKRLEGNDKSILAELGAEWVDIEEFAPGENIELKTEITTEWVKTALSGATKWQGQDGYRITVVNLGTYANDGKTKKIALHEDRLEQAINKLAGLQSPIPNDFALNPARFFNSPAASGRQIICNFCYVQRIGKRGIIDVWFPSEVHQRIAERIAANDPKILTEFGVEWAAIREFSLIKEAEFEEDFDPERVKKAMRDSIKWRGQDGYRVTVVMLGNYTHLDTHDELRIHDERMQEEITKLIHILYLDKESELISEQTNNALQSDQWTSADALPHVITTLTSMGVTGRGAAQSKKCAGIVTQILKLVEQLPKSHIVHDVAVGLTIPDHDSRHRREKKVDGYEKFGAFRQLISDIMAPLGHTSMSDLHGIGEKSTPKYSSTNLKMRGFRDLRAGNDAANVEAARRFVL